MCVALFAAVVCVLGGFEAGMVFAIRVCPIYSLHFSTHALINDTVLGE